MNDFVKQKDFDKFSVIFRAMLLGMLIVATIKFVMNVVAG